MNKFLSISFLTFFMSLNLNANDKDLQRSLISKLFSSASHVVTPAKTLDPPHATPPSSAHSSEKDFPSDWNDNKLEEKCGPNHCEEDCNPNHFDCSGSSLNLYKLCTHYLKATCGWIKSLRACKIKTDSLKACDIKTDDLTACNIETKDLKVTGDFKNCTNLKAWLSLTTTYTYTLGNVVSFDTIFDPHGDVSGSPAEYTVPCDGWYIIHAGYDSKGLVTPSPILGTPVSDIVINIDGAITTTSDLATLGWANRFSNKTMVVARLKQGAKVSLIINLKAVAGQTASTDIIGTMQLNGSPDTHITFLAIHYLSSDCCPPGPCPSHPCPACPPHPCPPHPCPPHPNSPNAAA